MSWSISYATVLCRSIERVVPVAGAHVALTGGCLYKDGLRKDLDLVFYRIRQVNEINMDLLWSQLEHIGVHKISGQGWCYKAEYFDLPIDCFFPEEQGGEYVPAEGSNIIAFPSERIAA